MTYYTKYKQLYVAIDSIIFGFEANELKILMTQANEQLPNKWSLIGGFVDPKESLDEAAHKVLFNLTGLQNIYIKQLYSFGNPNRVKHDRVITITYYSLIKITPDLIQCIEKNNSKWFSVKSPPKFEFDHEEIFNKALDRLRSEVRRKPIGFELLPEKFTIPQLKLLYESILDRTLDTRNFSRKIFSQRILIKTDEKDKTKSRKGAWLYKFDKEKYDELVLKGINFEI